MEKFQGREDEMWMALEKKYGPERAGQASSTQQADKQHTWSMQHDRQAMEAGVIRRVCLLSAHVGFTAGLAHLY